MQLKEQILSQTSVSLQHDQPSTGISLYPVPESFVKECYYLYGLFLLTEVDPWRPDGRSIKSLLTLIVAQTCIDSHRISGYSGMQKQHFQTFVINSTQGSIRELIEHRSFNFKCPTFEHRVVTTDYEWAHRSLNTLSNVTSPEGDCCEQHLLFGTAWRSGWSSSCSSSMLITSMMNE